MESLIDNPWHFGWHQGQEFDMDYDPGNWISTLTLNQLDIYSPRQAGDLDMLISALVAMTNHVNGTDPLDLDQRESHLNTIYLNYFNNHDLLEDEVFSYLDAFQTTFPPVFSDRAPVSISSLDPEAQLLIFLQQSIFDNQYYLTNVTSLEGIIYEFSEVFPGPVNPDATRSINALVQVDATHTYDPAARVVEDLAEAKRPTGYYAAPGEIIRITIPEEFVENGLSVMIGAHDSDLSSQGLTNRFNRISKTYPLSSTSTQIISPFGGGIYIKVPLNSQLGWINISIDGAVKSPYFSWQEGHKSDVSDWVQELTNHNVEWVDIESDRYMMTLPLNHVADLLDPSQLTTQWEQIMEGFRYTGGRPDQRPRSEYFLIDSRLPSGAFGTGYPQIIGEYSAPFGPFGEFGYYPTHVLNDEFWDSPINTTFHEMGHAVLHPTLIDEVESIVHIPAVYIFNTIYGLDIDQAFKYSSQEYLLLNEAALDWMITFNFRNNNDMGCDPTMDDLVCPELRYQHRGFAKYVDMAKQHGWQSVYNMNNVFYEEWSSNGMEDFLVSKDNVLQSASLANELNMAPLFHFWGHAPSTSLQTELAELPESDNILNQLIEYYNLIPENQAAFLSYRDILLSRKDPVHHDRINEAYDNYDSENYAQQMKDQICSIIETYFPDQASCEFLTSSNIPFLTNENLSLFPSPTNGQLTLSSNFQNYSIIIMDLNGNLIKELVNQSGSITLNIKSAPAGLYYIQATDFLSGKSSIEKVIKID